MSAIESENITIWVVVIVEKAKQPQVKARIARPT
jgi:hypothetical protein